VWNLRAALNVAALNCREATYLEITRNYGTYLKAHAKPLAAANKAGDVAFKAQFGKDGIAARNLSDGGLQFRLSAHSAALVKPRWR
jgi:hypothetical protein